MLENIIQQTQKEYETAHDDKIYNNHQYNIQYIIKTVGSSVIFLLSVIRISHKSLLNQ